jgi:hypothetical protein
LEPWHTRLHLPAIGLLVNTSLSTHLVAEVLDRVCDEDLIARDPGALESSVQHTTGGAHKWVPLQVLAVTGLLAHED